MFYHILIEKQNNYQNKTSKFRFVHTLVFRIFFLQFFLDLGRKAPTDSQRAILCTKRSFVGDCVGVRRFGGSVVDLGPELSALPDSERFA